VAVVSDSVAASQVGCLDRVGGRQRQRQRQQAAGAAAAAAASACAAAAAEDCYESSVHACVVCAFEVRLVRHIQCARASSLFVIRVWEDLQRSSSSAARENVAGAAVGARMMVFPHGQGLS